MKTTDLRSSLSEHPFLSELSEEHVAFLASCAKNRRLAAGELLFREEAPAEELLLIRKGRVGIELHAPPQGVHLLETLEAGDAIGWSTFFPPFTWGTDVRALEDGLAFSLDGDCLKSKLDREPTFGLSLMRALLGAVHRRLERSRLHRLDLYQR